MVGTTNETVDIPTEYRGKPVTEVADGGFKGNVDVNIPEDTNINKVGDIAFQNNTRLDPEDFANLSGGYTDSEGTTNKGVTDIGEGAFQGATGIATSEGQEDGLKNITIPENATTVGKDAFKDTGAEKITIPAEKEGNGDRNYNPGAFGPSDSLKKVVVEGPSTDLTGTEIAEAFGDNNRNVESLTIPADLIDTEDEVNALKEAFPASGLMNPLYRQSCTTPPLPARAFNCSSVRFRGWSHKARAEECDAIIGYWLCSSTS